MDITKLLPLLYQYGKIPVLLGIIIYLFRVVMDEDRCSLWRSRVCHVLYLVSGRRDAEKKYIAEDINGRINLARRRLHQGRTALPRAVNVEWVEGNPEGTYDIAEGEFVVRLDPSAAQEKNIAKLAMAVVGRTTLIGIRHLVEVPLQKAIDLNLVRTVLREVGDRKVLDWFFQEEYIPGTKESDIDKWNREVVEIDERGLFTRLLLVELDAFAKRIAGMVPRPYMMGEIENLVHFLYTIATKQVGQDVPLRFIRAHMGIGVILVARTSTLLTEGVEPYVKAMNYHVQRQLNSVYVIVFDEELLRDADEEAHRQFVKLTRELDREILQSSLIIKDFSLSYSCVDQQGRKRNAMCTRYLIQLTQ